MINFWNKLTTHLAGTEHQALYRQKLEKVDQSFEDLKETTRAVTKQAIELTDQLKRKLELTDKRFNTIINAVDDVIIVKTIDRQWVSVNEFTCKLFDIDRDICLGKTNEQVVELYPQLGEVINALDKIEKIAWNEHQPTKIQLSMDSDKKKGNNYLLDILITPIETQDKLAQEIVLVGQKEPKRVRRTSKKQQNGENV